MATNYYNAQIGVVDASGNVNVIYPITKSTNVDVTSGTYCGSGNTTVLQTALDRIVSKIGTIKSFAYSDLITGYSSTVTTQAVSASALKSAYDTLNSNKQGCPNERVQYNSDILTYFPDAGSHLNSRYEGMLFLGLWVNLTAAESCFLKYQIHAYNTSGSDYTSLKINSYSYESFSQSDQTIHKGFIFISKGSLLKTNKCSGDGDILTASYAIIWTCK